jgi:myosin protein heavy chain
MSVRNNPFARNAPPSPAPEGNGNGKVNGRPRSAVFTPKSPSPMSPSQTRDRSYSLLNTTLAPSGTVSRHVRENSRSSTNTPTATFAPSFIKTDEMRKPIDVVRGIEGENDFSGKRYVWLKDPQTAFVKGWVVEELEGNRILVQCDDGSVSHSHDGLYGG